MGQDKTAELEAENQVTDPTQTDEGTEGTDVDKQEGVDESPETAELKRIIEHKNRAIESLKKKQQEVKDDGATSDLLEEVRSLKETVNSFASRQQESELGAAVQKIASNSEEAALIRGMYEHRIVRTDDLEADLRAAKALANQSLILKEREELNASKQSMNSHSGAPVSGQSPTPREKSKNLTQRQIEIARMSGNDPSEVYS